MTAPGMAATVTGAGQAAAATAGRGPAVAR
jgi:hypothetical protein